MSLIWFRNHWYLYLFPAFICSAGIQLFTKLPAVVTGFLCASLIVQIAFTQPTPWIKGFIVFIIPVTLFLCVVVFFPGVRGWEGADTFNPYLTGTQILGRALLAGVGGVITVTAGKIAMLLWVESEPNAK